MSVENIGNRVDAIIASGREAIKQQASTDEAHADLGHFLTTLGDTLDTTVGRLQSYDRIRDEHGATSLGDDLADEVQALGSGNEHTVHAAADFTRASASARQHWNRLGSAQEPEDPVGELAATLQRAAEMARILAATALDPQVQTSGSDAVNAIAHYTSGVEQMRRYRERLGLGPAGTAQ